MRICWFHWISTGLLSTFFADQPRPFQMSVIAISPDPMSSWLWAPDVQNTSWSLIVSSLRMARSRSSGYRSAGATPSASSAVSKMPPSE